MGNELSNFKKQHLENYKRALLTIIENNTNALVEDDIMSLIRKPPLDSMDLLRTKLLSLAKKYKLVLNTENLDNILDNYRNYIESKCKKIKKVRIDDLTKCVEEKSLQENDILILYKKDFINVNKKIKKIFKESIMESYEKNIVKKRRNIFLGDIVDDLCSSFLDDYYKYVKNIYQKQLLENFDIKILVKDTTLINSVKEQSEHYLFTLNNSRLFNSIE